jgi:outer membrane protein assembly factor BamD (BamD/ComL family)
MRYAKLFSILLVLCLTFTGAIFAQEANEQEKQKQAYEQAKQAYELAKQYVNKKSWEQAVEAFQKAIKLYQKSKYMDGSLYYLGYSQNMYSNQMKNLEKQIEAKQEAIDNLNRLIKQYRESPWVDDAKVLRLEIAEELVKKGMPDFRDSTSTEL